MCNSPRGALRRNIPEYLKLAHTVVQVTSDPEKHAIYIKVWSETINEGFNMSLKSKVTRTNILNHRH